MSGLYLPGRGYVTKDEMRLNRVCWEYDERLSFRFDQPSGQWAVHIRVPRDEQENYKATDRPILGFPIGVMPTEDELIHKLNTTDGMKFGQQLLDDMNRRNAQHRAEQDRIHKEHVSNTADHVEHAMRKAGKSPVIKSLKKDPKRARG